MPKQRKKEESEMLRGDRDQVVRFKKARGRQDVPQVTCSKDE